MVGVRDFLMVYFFFLGGKGMVVLFLGFYLGLRYCVRIFYLFGFGGLF